MPAVIALLTEILSAVLEALGATNIIQGLLTKTAQEHAPFAIETTVISTGLDVANGTYGLAALRAVLDTIHEEQAADLVTLLAAIGTRQAAADPVILPTTPPSGYGGGAGASEVWAYQLGPGSQAAGDLVLSAGNLANFVSDAQLGFVGSYPGDWTLTGDFAFPGQAEPNINDVPVLDTATILSTDAQLIDWAGRVYPDAGITASLSGDLLYNQPETNWYWIYRMSDAEFQIFKLGPGAAPIEQPRPPVWTGLANAVFGTTTPIGLVTQIDGPMHGVIVLITSVPTTLPTVDWGGDVTSYKFIGQISFANDDDDREAFQQITFNDGLFMPKQMDIAGKANFHLSPGVELLCTPFTITPVT